MISTSTNFESKVTIGAKIYVTVLVYDIQDYTSLSEKISLDVAAQIIKTIFTKILGVLNSNKTDHYIFTGDGIFAVFYDELSENYAACRAMKTANEIASTTDQLSEELLTDNTITDPILFGIGVRSGLVQVLRVGKRQTIIGDTVNVAHRLEGLTRLCDHKILIDGNTIRLAEEIKGPSIDAGSYKFFDYLKLKGRLQSIETYCQK